MEKKTDESLAPIAPDERVCENCTHFLPTNKTFNECRRFPPRRSDSGIRLFAPVYATDWCGEFAPIPEDLRAPKPDIAEAIREVNEKKENKRGRNA